MTTADIDGNVGETKVIAVQTEQKERTEAAFGKTEQATRPGNLENETQNI